VTDTMRIASLDRDITYRPGTTDEQVINDVFRAGYHQPPIPLSPRTVLDCGAHIGLTMLDYRRMWPHADIVGVEMNVENAALAYINTQDPVLCVAVADSVSYVPFVGAYDPEADTWAYSLNGSNGRRVLTVSIPTIIAALAWPQVDFLKLDVEGQERAILQNPDELERVAVVLAELHDGYERPEAILDLRAAGFSAEPHYTHPNAVFGWRE
jgi:FkbM family methyltransferase